MPDPLSALSTTDPRCSSKSPNSVTFTGFGHQCDPALWQSQLPLRQSQRPRTRPSFSAHPEDRWQATVTNIYIFSSRP